MADDTNLTPDRTVPLDIANRLSPEDRDAMTGVTLMNVPQGAQLSAGVSAGDGRWTLSPEELNGLVLAPPVGWGGDIALAVSVAISPGAGEKAPTTVAFGVTIPSPPARKKRLNRSRFLSRTPRGPNPPVKTLIRLSRKPKTLPHKRNKALPWILTSARRRRSRSPWM